MYSKKEYKSKAKKSLPFSWKAFYYRHDICKIAEGFGKRKGFPNGIRRGGFAHSRKKAGFKAFSRWNLSVYSSVLQVEILISTYASAYNPLMLISPLESASLRPSA